MTATSASYTPLQPQQRPSSAGGVFSASALTPRASQPRAADANGALIPLSRPPSAPTAGGVSARAHASVGFVQSTILASKLAPASPGATMSVDPSTLASAIPVPATSGSGGAATFRTVTLPASTAPPLPLQPHPPARPSPQSAARAADGASVDHGAAPFSPMAKQVPRLDVSLATTNENAASAYGFGATALGSPSFSMRTANMMASSPHASILLSSRHASASSTSAMPHFAETGETPRPPVSHGSTSAATPFSGTATLSGAHDSSHSRPRALKPVDAEYMRSRPSSLTPAWRLRVLQERLRLHLGVLLPIETRRTAGTGTGTAGKSMLTPRASARTHAAKDAEGEPDEGDHHHHHDEDDDSVPEEGAHVATPAAMLAVMHETERLLHQHQQLQHAYARVRAEADAANRRIGEWESQVRACIVPSPSRVSRPV